MTLPTDITELESAVRSKDDRIAQDAADRLAAHPDESGMKFLITLIGSEDPWLRDTAAHAIEKHPTQKALEPLLKAIFNPQTKGYNAELVYALQSLDCSRKLTEIFDILFYFGYECKWYAHSVLNDQEFEFTRGDILDIKEKWEDILRDPSRCPDFDTVKEDIQNMVDGFTAYLDEPADGK